MKKSLLILVISCFLNAEPSAFELQSGVTKKDINVLQSSSKNLQSITTDVQARLNSVEQIQDGLQSLVEGQNAKIKQITDEGNVVKNQVGVLQAQMEVQQDQSKKQEEIMDLLKVQILSQQDEIRKLQEAIKGISEVVEKNNETLLQQLGVLSKTFIKEEKKSEKQFGDSIENTIENTKVEEDKELQKDSATLLSDAKSSMRLKNYVKAQKILNFLIEKKYKLGEVYFMLGDISYSKKEYQKAVSFYKKSFTLDENASYMPVLLWRTAWSFRYLRDIKNYERFTNILVRLYPNSEQAQKILEMKEKIKDNNGQN